MKKCSTLLIIREMQIKPSDISPSTDQNGQHQKSTKINAGEGVEKKESSFIVGGNVNWFSRYEEHDAVSFIKKEK